MLRVADVVAPIRSRLRERSARGLRDPLRCGSRDRFAHASRGAGRNDVRGHVCAGGDDAAGRDHASLTDDRAAQHHGVAADQRAIFDGTVIEHRAVPDGRVVADNRRAIVGRVNDGVIFDGAARADSDRAAIGANDDPEPIDDSSPTMTSPTKTAVGATKALAATRGAFPRYSMNIYAKLP